MEFIFEKTGDGSLSWPEISIKDKEPSPVFGDIYYVSGIANQMASVFAPFKK